MNRKTQILGGLALAGAMLTGVTACGHDSTPVQQMGCYDVHHHYYAPVPIPVHTSTARTMTPVKGSKVKTSKPSTPKSVKAPTFKAPAKAPAFKAPAPKFGKR